MLGLGKNKNQASPPVEGIKFLVTYIWSNFGIEIYVVVTKKGIKNQEVETYRL